MKSYTPITSLLILFILMVACTPAAPERTLPALPPTTTQQTPNPPAATASNITPNTPLSIPVLDPAAEADAYWVRNPTSGARLYVRTFYPDAWNGNDLLPALALMPGGIGKSDPDKAAHLAGEGFLVITFDADGRGRSEGVEDYNGFITQDGLAAVILAATALPGLDATRYGLVSYSYGVTAASGALARHPDLPIDFFIDWEGPVDRNYTTTGCREVNGRIDWQPCEEDAWWAEREAVNFIGQVQVPYQRIQSQSDHVQQNNNHAIDIINAAVAGIAPWVRLNAYPQDQTYDIMNPPAMLPDSMDKRTDATIAEYARFIMENVLPVLR
jgi:pimeloyl-ACP methyl ester carboxylesterase